MPHASLTRRVAFAAAHRYRRPEWDDARNEATFGACARPSFHGHGYVCEVTVRGPLSDEQRARLEEISERCPVQRTLTGDIRIDGEVAFETAAL